MQGAAASDSTLLDRIAERDEGALRELYDRHAAWLLLRLQRRTSDSDLAADAVHDTFVAVWKKPRSFRGDGDVGAWLWGIALRQLISRLRKREAPTPVTSQVISAISPTVRSAEDELLLAIEHGSLGDALRSLSPELQQVLQATVIDGLSTREAAHLLGLPQGTVKTRLRTAKTRMREHLVLREEWGS